MLWLVRLLAPVLALPPLAAADAVVAHGHGLHVGVPHAVDGGGAYQPQLAAGKTALLRSKSESENFEIWAI